MWCVCGVGCVCCVVVWCVRGAARHAENPPMCRLKTPLCVRSGRLRAYGQHARMCSLQVSDECELHNKLPLCVVSETSRRNLFGRQVQGRASLPISHRVVVPVVAKVLITSC